MAQGKPLTHFQVVYYHSLQLISSLTAPGHGYAKESTYSLFHCETQEPRERRSGDEEHGVQETQPGQGGGRTWGGGEGGGVSRSEG